METSRKSWRRRITALALICVFLPLTGLLIFEINQREGTLSPLPQAADGYWNLVPEDEFVWILNETLMREGKEFGQHLSLLKSTVVSIGDSLLDEDQISDLFIDNKLCFGSDTWGASLGLPLFGIDEIIQFINIITSASNVNLLTTIISGDYNIENTSIPIRIPSSVHITQSQFYTLLAYFINYLNKIGYKLNSVDIPTWNYELIGRDAKNLTNAGIYLKQNLTSSNNISLRPLSRNWSQGIVYAINDFADLAMSDPSTYLSLHHNVESESDIMHHDTSYDSFYANRLGFSFQIKNNPDIAFLIDLSNTTDELTWENRSRGISQHLLIENNSLYYYEKQNISIRAHVSPWDVTVMANPESGNWTKLGDLTPNQWNNITIDLCQYNAPREETMENSTGYIKINNGPKVIFQQLGEVYNFQTYHLKQIYFSVVRARANGIVEFDEFGSESYDKHWVNNGESAFPTNAPKSTFANVYRWLEYLNLNAFMILPAPSTFQIDSLFTFLQQSIFSAAPVGITLPEITITPQQTSINATSAVIESIMDLIDNHVIDNNVSIPYFEGAADWSIVLTFDKVVNCLSGARIFINYKNLGITRDLRMDLIKTNTPERMASSYIYYNETIYSATPPYTYQIKSENIISRLNNDSYPNKIDGSKYTIQFNKIIDDLFEEISPATILWQVISQNSVIVISGLVGIVSANSVVISTIIRALKRRRQA